MPLLDTNLIRQDFPILGRTVRNGKKLVYLDNAATSQKPLVVLDAERNFYLNHNAAAHRGAHLLAEEATDAFEGARAIVADFISAQSSEIIFTKSATESINVVSYGFSNHLSKGDPFYISKDNNIVVTQLEHHANLLPWQQLAKRSGATLSWLGITADAQIDISNIDSMINDKTKIVAITHQSNVSGAITQLEPIVKRAREVGAMVLLDACQSVPHMPVDVNKLNVDFLTYSGHKAVGPTGVGVLWGRSELLEKMEPMITGGSMIDHATIESATWAKAPKKFEAGVPNMAQAVGLGTALKYLTKIGMDKIQSHEEILVAKALTGLQDISGVEIIGSKSLLNRGSAISFTLEGVHPHDVGQVLDDYGIAVRTGHHCAWPLMQELKLNATTRASFYLYNTPEEVDIFLNGVREVKKFFKV
ncbi:MAG: SufS family cysteine desulfurase [Candidatus Nanopelagicaceae bacterium]|nr:SufS family cysteine desulfurase [Candidatus Nanopelagicaceae bacterium]